MPTTSFPVQTQQADYRSATASFDAPSPPPHLVSSMKYWRLRGTLRRMATAALSSPKEVLALAHRWSLQAHHDESRDLAFAVSDLLMTGRAAHLGLTEWLRGRPPTLSRVGAQDSPAARAALDSLWLRMREVDAHVSKRGARGAFEPTAGSKWIACTAEIDIPRRPVNVGMTSAAQDELTITVPSDGTTLTIRWAVAGNITPTKKLVVYLPGLGSRAEEADGIAEVLKGQGYLVASFDYPSHGYSAGAPVHRDIALDYGKDGDCPGGFVYLERMTEYAALIIAEIERRLGRKAVCLVGGSLGATLSMRLSMRRDHTRPPAVAIWSPAGLWGPMNADPLKLEIAVKQRRIEATTPEFDAPRGHLPGISSDDEDARFPLGRESYFGFNFEKQADNSRSVERWWGPTFRATSKGKSHIRGALTDRLEVYNERMRRWQCRLAYEQLCFSIHRHGLDALIGGDDTAGLRPVLLLCGTKDNDFGAKIFDNAKALASRLAKRGHPGGAVWLDGAGHSIHDECPAQVAAAIHAFLQRTAP